MLSVTGIRLPTRNALISSRISNLSPIIRPRSWREKTPRYIPSEYFRKKPLNRLHQAIRCWCVSLWIALRCVSSSPCNTSSRLSIWISANTASCPSTSSSPSGSGLQLWSTSGAVASVATEAICVTKESTAQAGRSQRKQASPAISSNSTPVSSDGCSSMETSKPAPTKTRYVVSFFQKRRACIDYSPDSEFTDGGTGLRSRRKSKTISNAPVNTTICIMKLLVKTMNTNMPMMIRGTSCLFA